MEAFYIEERRIFMRYSSKKYHVIMCRNYKISKFNAYNTQLSKFDIFDYREIQTAPTSNLLRGNLFLS